MSIPSSMRAVRVHKTGDSSVLTLDTDVPLPAVKDADVLVKLDYAGVNFIDIYDRTGVYPQKLPFIAGREGAGTIVKLGSGVDSSLGLSEGDKVAVYAQGTIADFIATPADKVMKLPASVSTKIGAAVILQGLTAWTMVQDAHKVEKGQTILIQAAAGGTGGMLVQMCKHLGATVIGTVSTPQKAEIAKKHGCDHVILYRDVDVETEVNRITDGKGCHAVLSGVGKSTFKADLACTRRKGTFVTFGNASGVVEGVRPLDLSKRNVKLIRPTLGNYITERDEFVQRTTELLDLIASGAVKVELGGEYELRTVGQAQDDLGGQKTTGKLVVKIA